MRVGIAVVVAILAVACSKKDEPPAAKVKAAPAPTGAPKSSGGHPADSFVPESLLSQLGDSGAVLAVDFKKLDLARRLGPLVPDFLSCVRDMVSSADLLVVGVGDPSSIGFITKLPERTTQTCLATLGYNPTPGKDGAVELSLDDDHLSIRWRDDTAIVTRLGDKPVSGTLAKSLRARIAAMPPNAGAWVISEHEKDGLAAMTIWIELSDTALGMHASFEGTRAGVARQSALDIVEGIKEGVADLGLQAQDRWFKLSSTASNAAVDATIPLSAFLKH